MEPIFDLISLENIYALPWYVSLPGALLIVLFLVRAIRSLITLRIIRVFTSLVLAFLIAVILSQGGEAIVRMIGIDETVDATSVKPASPSAARYSA